MIPPILTSPASGLVQLIAFFFFYPNLTGRDMNKIMFFSTANMGGAGHDVMSLIGRFLEVNLLVSTVPHGCIRVPNKA